jgi:hypothetical protein
MGAANPVGVVWMSAEMILDLQRLLRARAETLSADRPYLENELSRFANQLEEIFLRLLAGPLHGLTAGYFRTCFWMD